MLYSILEENGEGSSYSSDREDREENEDREGAAAGGAVPEAAGRTSASASQRSFPDTFCEAGCSSPGPRLPPFQVCLQLAWEGGVLPAVVFFPSVASFFALFLTLLRGRP